MIPRLALCALLLVLGTGCGFVGGLFGGDDDLDTLEPVDIREVRLSAAPGTHDDSPIRIDLVRVDDVAVFQGLVRMDLAAWFAGEAEAFIDTHPLASVERYEIVPGTEVGPFDVALRDDVVAVLFCEVPGDRSGVQRVVTEGAIRIRVDDERGCVVAEDLDR